MPVGDKPGDADCPLDIGWRFADNYLHVIHPEDRG
jgi:hypothetical protein